MRDEKVDLIVTSGGLGPTADDLTAQVVGEFAGRSLVLDEALEQRIAEIVGVFAPLEARPGSAARREPQAGDGARGRVALDPVGTAPGLVVPADEQIVVVLPGPPRELQESWERALETDLFKQALWDTTDYRQRMLRLFGIPESEIAETLRVVEQEIDFSGLEITTCLRRGELEVVIRSDPESDAAALSRSTASPSGTRTRSSRPTAARSTSRSRRC